MDLLNKLGNEGKVHAHENAVGSKEEKANNSTGTFLGHGMQYTSLRMDKFNCLLEFVSDPRRLKGLNRALF